MSEVNTVHIGADAARQRARRARVEQRRDARTAATRRRPLPADLAPDELTRRAGRGAARQGRRRAPRARRRPRARGQTVLALNGRFGPFVQLGELEEGSKDEAAARVAVHVDGPRHGRRSRSALQLLSLPRVVGADADGEEITAQNGRYGPVPARRAPTAAASSPRTSSSRSRSPRREAIFAQPKQRRGQARSRRIAELGAHPDTGKPVRVLDGRFGPYVTDGTTNATVPRGIDPDAVTLEEAVDLLARAGGEGPGEEERPRAQEAAEEEGREEDRPRRRPAKKAAKKTAAKKPRRRRRPTKRGRRRGDDAERSRRP